MQSQKPFFVGLITLLLIIAIMSLILWKNSIFTKVKSYHLIGEFVTINGLLNNSIVKYRGYPIGRVNKIIPKQKIIEVHFFIQEDYTIPFGSNLKIVFDGLVGEKYLEIIPNKTSKKNHIPGDRLPGYSSAGLADFIDVGTQNLVELRKILTTLSTVFGDENIAIAMKDVVLGLQGTTKNLKGLMASLETITSSKKINNIINNLDLLLSNLNKALSEDDIQKINSTIDNIEEFSANLNEILKDSEFKKSLIKTFKETESTFKYSSNFLSTISRIQLLPSADFLYSENSKDNLVYYLDFNFWLDNSYLNLGISNYLTTDKLMNVYLNFPVDENIRFSYGLIKSKPGFGVDYLFKDSPFSTSFMMYHFGQLKIDLFLQYYLTHNIKIKTGYFEINKKSRSIFFGTSINAF